MLRVHQRQADDIALVSLHGRVHFHNGDRLPRTIDSLLARGARKIALNLGGMVSDDGAAISALLHSLHTVRESGGDIRLVDPARRIDDLVTLTTLCLHFTVYDTDADAIAGFRGHPPAEGAVVPSSWAATAAA